MLGFVIGFGGSLHAQDDPSYAQRLELAKQMHELRPVREQVNGAIDQYASRLAQDQQESFKTAMRSVLNAKALEKISTDAYAEVFTQEELASMVAYYSKPEAQSASEKLGQYAGIVYPQIVKMLDKAAMRVKAGGN